MEKKASRQLIQAAMADARVTMAEALELMEEAHQAKREVQDKIDAEKEQHREALITQRDRHARESSRLKQKLAAKINQYKSRNSTAMNDLRQKYDANTNKMKKRLAEARDKIVQQRHSWEDRMSSMSTKLSKSEARVHNEKTKRRQMVQQQIDAAVAREEEMQKHIDDLEELNMEMAGDWAAERKGKKAAVKSLKLEKEKSEKRLEKYREERRSKNEIKDELARVLREKEAQEAVLNRYRTMLEEMKVSKKELRRRRKTGRRGGGAQWEVWVVQLICELLVNGTPPSAIPDNIATFMEGFYGEEPEDWPSVNFCRGCRVLVQIIGETITGMKLAEFKDWKQIFFDATTRRQTPFLAVVIGLMTDEGLDHVTVSSCIFLEDESAQTTADGVETKVWHCL